MALPWPGIRANGIGAPSPRPSDRTPSPTIPLLLVPPPRVPTLSPPSSIPPLLDTPHDPLGRIGAAAKGAGAGVPEKG